MTFPEDASFVFLVITWGDDQREAFGPYMVRDEAAHLEEIHEQMKEWRAEHPDRPNAAADLFATVHVPPGGYVAVCSNCGKSFGERACGMNHAWVAHVRGLADEDDTPDLETAP